MSRYMTPLSPDRITRRRVTVGGVDLILWLRINQGRTEMAIDKVGKRRASLRWRPLAEVIINAFALDVGLLFGEQLEIEGIKPCANGDAQPPRPRLQASST